jgi:hypothetical protein
MLDTLKRVDPINGWILLVVMIVLLGAFELGRWLSRRREASEQGRNLHSANVLNGMLTLLAFLLAFSFGITADQFERRRQIVLDEANAIGTTYLRSKYLPGPESEQMQRLLLDYVKLRVFDGDAGDLQQRLARSESLHTDMWQVAVSLEQANPNSEFAGLFIVSLNQMIDLHESRTTVALQYRLPVIVMITLFLIALLTLLVMGYSAGLRSAGDALLTMSVVVAVAAVLVLIMDLDRPVQRSFSVSQQALIDVRDSLNTDVRE